MSRIVLDFSLNFFICSHKNLYEDRRAKVARFQRKRNEKKCNPSAGRKRGRIYKINNKLI